MAPNDFLSALLSGSSGSSTGSDAALNAFKNNLGQSDYYKMAAAPLLSAKFDTSTWKPAESFAATAAQSFLGTALQMLGQKSESDQLLKAAAVLPQLQRDPMSVGVPEGVDPGAFAALKMDAIRNMFQKDTALEKLKEQYVLGRLGKIDDAQIEMQTAASLAKAKKLGEIQAYDAVPGGAASNPESPQYKANQNKQQLEKDFYNRITSLPQYKLLADVDSNFRALKDLAKQDSKAADIGLISTIARIRDPNSTVREGEFQINSDVQSLLDAQVGNWRSVITGKSRLDPAAKAKLIASVVPKYNELGQSYLEARDPLLNALKAQGGSPENVPVLGFSPFDMQSLVISPETKVINGATYARVPGGWKKQ